jgi:hypothetical protein
VTKKTRRKDSDTSGTNFLDYPESMSLYERESLAAEATLAERKKKLKPKTKEQEDNWVASGPTKNRSHR